MPAEEMHHRDTNCILSRPTRTCSTTANQLTASQWNLCWVTFMVCLLSLTVAQVDKSRHAAGEWLTLEIFHDLTGPELSAWLESGNSLKLRGVITTCIWLVMTSSHVGAASRSISVTHPITQLSPHSLDTHTLTAPSPAPSKDQLQTRAHL